MPQTFLGINNIHYANVSHFNRVFTYALDIHAFTCHDYVRWVFVRLHDRAL